MDSSRQAVEPTRREFLHAGATVAAASIAALAAKKALAAPAPTTSKKEKPLIGIQTGPQPLCQGDLDRFLGTISQTAGVNALFPFVYTYAPSTAAMPEKGFRGGNFSMPHMQYYKGTPLTYEDMRAPEFGDVDLLARTIPVAKKHGIKTFAWIIEDHGHSPTKNWEPLYEIDFHGRRVLKHPAGPCFNNPQYLAFILGLVEDYCRSYEIDGVMWGSERQGGFFNALGAYAHGSSSDPGLATCFCEFCIKKAKETGIDAERAKQGFTLLEKFVRDGRAGKRPRDGYFVTFMQLLLRYPEMLAWEEMWNRSRESLQAQMYKLVKSIRPDIPVGWHIWHNVSFSPFHRAEIDYARLAPFSDFIKPVVYNNCAGERMHGYVDSVCENVFGDLPKPQALEMLYHMLDYKEADYDSVTGTGFSADYVFRETQRALDDIKSTPVQIWPGIDIDVPVPAGASKSSTDGVKQATLAAFKAGAPGVILSRNFPEMNLEHLAGAGAALDELGLR